MSDSRYPHLAFLLAVGATPYGCGETPVESDTATDGTDGTDGSSSTGGASTAGTTGTGTTGASDSASGATSTGATSGSGATTGSGGSATDGGSGTTGGTTTGGTTTGGTTTGGTGGIAVCPEYAAKYVECVPAYFEPAVVGWCETYFENGAQDGQDCIDALDDYYACLLPLGCGNFPQRCSDEDDAVVSDCPNLPGW
jgi:hypothetical protein